MLKKLIYKWLLSWISLYDILYLVKKIMRRNEIKEIDLTDYRNNDGKTLHLRTWYTIDKGP